MNYEIAKHELDAATKAFTCADAAFWDLKRRQLNQQWFGTPEEREAEAIKIITARNVTRDAFQEALRVHAEAKYAQGAAA